MGCNYYHCYVLMVCVYCVCKSPVWPSPPVAGPLRDPPMCVGSLWVVSCSCFPLHLFIVSPLARAHALAVESLLSTILNFAGDRCCTWRGGGVGFLAYCVLCHPGGNEAPRTGGCGWICSFQGHGGGTARTYGWYERNKRYFSLIVLA